MRFSAEQTCITAIYGMGHTNFRGDRIERFLVSLHDQFGDDYYRWVDGSILTLCMGAKFADLWINLCRPGVGGQKPMALPQLEIKLAKNKTWTARFVPLTGSEARSPRHKYRIPITCVAKAYINAVGDCLDERQINALREAGLSQRTLNPFLNHHKYPFLHHTPRSASRFPTNPGKYLIFVDDGKHCRSLVVSDDGAVTIFSDNGAPLVPAHVERILSAPFKLAEIFQRPAKKPKLLPRPTKIRKRLAQRKAYNKQKKKKYKSSGTYISF
jgi:hypothetical protein